MKVFNFRERERIVLKNGFQYKKQTGSHVHYKHPDGRLIVLKRQSVNRMIWQRLVKENSLQGVEF